MRRSIPAILIATLWLVLASVSAGAELRTLIGAGTETGGWVALDYPDTRPPAPGSDAARPPTHQLYFMPAEAPPGALYGSGPMPQAPIAIAATGARAVLLFPPSSASRGNASPGWGVRALTAFDQPDPLPPVFEPAGRLEVLPALVTDGDVVGFSGAGGSSVIALIRPIADATGSPIGSAYQLQALINGVWKPVETPDGFSATLRCRAIPSPDGIGLLLEDPNESSRAALWRAPLPSSVDADDPSPISPQWRREWVSIDLSGGELIATGAGHVLSASRAADGDTRLTLHVAGTTTEIATLDAIPERFTLTRVGDTTALIYLSDESTPRIMTTVVHTTTGEVLHQGPHVRVSPVSPDDLRFLGFVLALVLMTALVFVLRPSAASSKEVLLPTGTALAAPERRLAAGLIDFAIPVLVVVELWGVTLTDLLLAPIAAERADEFWPFAVASSLFFFHTVLSEWLFKGRTIGKAILRIRVASINAKPLTFWQCVSRNTIKLVCPPLLILIFADPRRRHPGDTLSGAVVIARARGPLPPVDTPSDNDQRDEPGA